MGKAVAIADDAYDMLEKMQHVQTQFGKMIIPKRQLIESLIQAAYEKWRAEQ